MRPCRACSLVHSPRVNCGVFRRQQAAALARAIQAPVTHQEAPVPVTHQEPARIEKARTIEAQVKRKGDRHRKTPERKAYHTELVRKLRAKAAHA